MPGLDFKVFPLSLEFLLDTIKSIIFLLGALVCLFEFSDLGVEKLFLPFSHDHIYNSSFYLDTLAITQFLFTFLICARVWMGGWVGTTLLVWRLENNLSEVNFPQFCESPVSNSSWQAWLLLVAWWLTHTAIPALILGKGLFKEWPSYKSTNYT